MMEELYIKIEKNYAARAGLMDKWLNANSVKAAEFDKTMP